MDELEEIRQSTEVYEPWEDRSGDAHYDLYEKGPGEPNRFNSPLVRVVAALFLILILWGTFQFITWSFVKPPPTAEQQSVGAPMT